MFNSTLILRKSLTLLQFHWIGSIVWSQWVLEKGYCCHIPSIEKNLLSYQMYWFHFLQKHKTNDNTKTMATKTMKKRHLTTTATTKPRTTKTRITTSSQSSVDTTEQSLIAKSWTAKIARTARRATRYWYQTAKLRNIQIQRKTQKITKLGLKKN